MTRLSFILLSFLGYYSYGQAMIIGNTTIEADAIYGDSINKSPNIAFNNKIKLEQIDKSKAKVDIRLYKLFSLSNTKQVYRLYLIDTTWNATMYKEWNKPKKIKKYRLSAKSSYESLFSQLVSYNIMTLPYQSELKSKMRKDVHVTADGDTTERKIHVMDGESYSVEIKIGNKHRVYQFNNPETYSRFYDKVSELKNYLNIVQAFDGLLQRK